MDIFLAKTTCMRWTRANYKQAEARRPAAVKERYLYSLFLERKLWMQLHRAAVDKGVDLSVLVREVLKNYVERNISSK